MHLKQRLRHLLENYEEESIYNPSARERMLDDGLLTNEEEGFMKGYEDSFSGEDDEEYSKFEEFPGGVI